MTLDPRRPPGPVVDLDLYRRIGAPQAAPMMTYRFRLRVTLAGADLRRSWLTVANAQAVWPLRCSSRTLT
jgi:hypothetical protein